MSVGLAYIRQIMTEADCPFNDNEIEATIDRVAEVIGHDLGETNPAIFCVINGGLIFSGKLLPLFGFPLGLSYLYTTHYRNETSGGKLFWKVRPETSFIDRDVLIIDGILDEGHTFSAIIDFCKHVDACAVHIVVLVDKEHKHRTRPDLRTSPTGPYCTDRYVFGYDVDYRGCRYNAAGIFVVKGLWSGRTVLPRPAIVRRTGEWGG